MRRAFVALLVASVAACGGSESADGNGGNGGSVTDASAGSSGSGGSTPDAEAGSGGSSGSSLDASAGSAGDGGSDIDASAGSGGDASVPDAAPEASDEDADAEVDAGTYRTSLSVCWTDPTCPRAFAIAHGGAWAVSGPPYDSNAAIAAAYAADVDGVKIDVRVTKDNVPVISHSSPIEYWESLDCGGKRIEEMTVDQVTSCHRLPSLTEIFQRLDDVLNYLRGKMMAQLTVKRSEDYARTIEEVHALGAEDYAFLEISTSELQNQIPTIPGADTIYYLIEVGSNLAEVDTLLDTIQNPRAFMFEFDPTVDVSTLTTTRLHPAGVRSFTYTDAAAPTVGQLQALFEGGYDVVSSQAAANGVQARKTVNQNRGVSPP